MVAERGRPIYIGRTVPKFKDFCFLAKQPLVKQGFMITHRHTTFGRTPLDE
jgi:hypothetical protein